jgi:large subunit ribosomal protein L4
MANVDVVNLNGEKVGTMELADEVFAASEVNEALLWEAVKHYRAAMRQGTARHQESQAGGRVGQEALEAEGNRPRAYRFGAVAAVASWRHGARTSAAQLRLRFPAQEAAGRAALGAGGEAGRRQADHCGFLEIKEAKTKLYRAALDKLGANRTTLIVESGKSLSQALFLGVRNLERVELMLNNEVHPYDLLRYERAIFSKDAIELLGESAEEDGLEAQAGCRRSRQRQKEVA